MNAEVRRKRVRWLAALLCASGIRVGVALAAEDFDPAAVNYSFHGDPAVPDISGIWMGSYTGTPGYALQTPAPERNITRWAPWPAPVTPAYQKLVDERVAAAKVGRAIEDGGASCLPLGLVRALTAKSYPDEVIQTPGAVSILVFGRGSITIWTDGRPHPQNLQPSYKGHSIGRWQGDTLHVDTVGIIPSVIDSGPRTPHSGKLHVKWTIQPVTPDTLHVHVTLYDEVALTEPMTTTNIWRRVGGPRWEVLDDQSCFENNRNLPDASGAPGFTKF